MALPSATTGSPGPARSSRRSPPRAARRRRSAGGPRRRVCGRSRPGRRGRTGLPTVPVIRSAPWTTWKLVSTWPPGSSTMPVPVPMSALVLDLGVDPHHGRLDLRRRRDRIAGGGGRAGATGATSARTAASAMQRAVERSMGNRPIPMQYWPCGDCCRRRASAQSLRRRRAIAADGSRFRACRRPSPLSPVAGASILQLAVGVLGGLGCSATVSSAVESGSLGRRRHRLVGGFSASSDVSSAVAPRQHPRTSSVSAASAASASSASSSASSAALRPRRGLRCLTFSGLGGGGGSSATNAR